MEKTQVRKALDAIESIGKMDCISVTLTAGYTFYSNETSMLSFNDSTSILSVIRTNNNPTRNTANEDRIQVIFVDYDDIDMIGCLVDEPTVISNVDIIGSDFDKDKLKTICKGTAREAVNQTSATAPKDWFTKDEDGNITSYHRKDANGNIIRVTDVPNVPSLD